MAPVQGSQDVTKETMGAGRVPTEPSAVSFEASGSEAGSNAPPRPIAGRSADEKKRHAESQAASRRRKGAERDHLWAESRDWSPTSQDRLQNELEKRPSLPSLNGARGSEDYKERKNSHQRISNIRKSMELQALRKVAEERKSRALVEVPGTSQNVSKSRIRTPSSVLEEDKAAGSSFEHDSFHSMTTEQLFNQRNKKVQELERMNHELIRRQNPQDDDLRPQSEQSERNRWGPMISGSEDMSDEELERWESGEGP